MRSVGHPPHSDSAFEEWSAFVVFAPGAIVPLLMLGLPGAPAGQVTEGAGVLNEAEATPDYHLPGDYDNPQRAGA